MKFLEINGGEGPSGRYFPKINRQALSFLGAIWFLVVILFISLTANVLATSNGGAIVSSETGAGSVLEEIVALRSDALYERFGEREGLTDSTVYELTQDDRGLLWVATGAGGVNVFDGQRFRPVQRGTGSSLPSSGGISTIVASRQGLIWVGTWGGGLEVYDPATDRARRIDENSLPQRIQALLESKDGTLWVGSAGAGLYRLDIGSDRLVSALPGSQIEGRERIWSLAEDKGGLWVATSADLIYLPKDGRGELSIALPAHARTLLVDGDLLWIGVEDQLYRLNRLSRDGLELVATDLTPVNVLHRLPDRLLIGTESGLRAVHPIRGETMWPLPGYPELVVSDDNIRDILQDSSGLLWLATREGGLLKLRAEVPAFQGALLPGPSRTVVTLCELAPDRLLIGTRRGLWLAERRDSGYGIRPLPSTQGLSITYLQSRRGSGAWVGTREGLFLYDEVGEKAIPAPRSEHLPQASVNALFEEAEDRLWISYWRVGVVRFDPTTGRIDKLDTGTVPALPHNEVLSLTASGDDLWINDSPEGLVHIDLEKKSTERWTPGEPTVSNESITTALPNLPSGLIRALHVDRRGSLWIASNFGVAKMDLATRSVTPVPLGRDRPVVRVAAVLSDPEGRVWVATAQGLVRFNVDDKEPVWFTEADGLVTSQFVWSAAAKGASGRLHFGGVGGFVSFDPTSVGDGVRAPEVSIVSVLVDGQGAPRNDSLTLHPGQRKLTIGYAALDFRRPELNRFQVLLSGLDDDWRPVTDHWEVTYMNLEPGPYEFRVRAANSNGTWNDVPATLAITVLPPWWQTVWGRLGTWGLALIGFVAWSRWRTLRVHRLNRDLEERVVDRTVALRQANEELARAAHSDFLTGLPNRRGFMASMNAFTEEDTRGCVAIADLDDFKAVNDRFGHEVGDQVLREAAVRVLGLVRSNDLVARWGGEELVFLFRGLDLAAGIEAGERLRRGIAERAIETQSGPVAITATFGVAEHQDGESVDQWINRADHCLYAGKAAGKNHVSSTS